MTAEDTTFEGHAPPKTVGMPVGEMNAEQLREELRLAHTEYVDLRTRYEATLKERRIHDEQVRAAAEREAHLRALEYAKDAFSAVQDKLRTLLIQVAEISEKTRPHELEELARTASVLARVIEQDADVKAVHQVTVDMEAAYQQVVRDKKRLWNALQRAREAVSEPALVELQAVSADD